MIQSHVLRATKTENGGIPGDVRFWPTADIYEWPPFRAATLNTRLISSNVHPRMALTRSR
jgi:hypothetical protein